jgi:hypothetical protein
MTQQKQRERKNPRPLDGERVQRIKKHFDRWSRLCALNSLVHFRADRDGDGAIRREDWLDTLRKAGLEVTM